MTIKEEDFEMTPSTDLGTVFDLSLLQSVTTKSGEEVKQLKVVGYGMSFASCVKAIISNRVSMAGSEYSISEYIKAYNEESKKLREAITMQ